VGFEAVKKKGLDPEADRKEVIRELADAGKRVLEKTGAQVLVLGCLSYLGMGKDLEALLDVPVIDPAMAAVTLAESMVRQKLSHSAKAFLTRDALTTVL
jgi:allantoin racemase